MSALKNLTFFTDYFFSVQMFLISFMKYVAIFHHHFISETHFNVIPLLFLFIYESVKYYCY